MKIQIVSDSLARGSDYLKRDKMALVLDLAKKAFFIWVAVFIISEIAISGGRYEFNIYLTIVQLVIILTVLIYFMSVSKLKTKSLKENLIWGLGLAVWFAILDFLIINLLLEKNSLSIYKNWETYIAYGLLLLIPVFRYSLKIRPQSLTPPPPPEGENEISSKAIGGINP
ncbi:MAG: hypothetical protein OEV37_01560 [Candidatus Berkelbacteria bacterium]|nr:hypothetical protein [Candidatus Berkelbacteria bacterium]